LDATRPPRIPAPKFRLYVDEVGNHDLDVDRSKPAERYLSLTGIILDLEYVRTTVSPAIEALKSRHLKSHPDDPIVLHRREMIDKKPPFQALRDPKVCALFDRELMALIRNLDYVVITVVIDKWEHYSRYGVWTSHPYHYCMEVLVERFVLHLNSRGAVGDVLAESRGAREDQELRQAFTTAYDTGTSALGAKVHQARLTSRELKIKPKKANIAGLQLADLIAYPAYRGVVWRRSKVAFPTSMTGQIATLLEASKFRRSPGGTIAGWGTKWLP
jgi:hypothetical protein